MKLPKNSDTMLRQETNSGGRMKLKDLLRFKKVVIQCHDNPDADALASGYALKWFFEKNNKDVRFIYRGRYEVKKSNLLIMIKKLEIPVEYAPFISDEEDPDLLITVDCQYGEKNVTKTSAKKIATIDHHRMPFFIIVVVSQAIPMIVRNWKNFVKKMQKNVVVLLIWKCQKKLKSMQTLCHTQTAYTTHFHTKLSI